METGAIYLQRVYHLEIAVFCSNESASHRNALQLISTRMWYAPRLLLIGWSTILTENDRSENIYTNIFPPLFGWNCAKKKKKLQRKQNKLLFCYIICSWNRSDEWLADTHTLWIWLDSGSQDTCSKSPVLYTAVICYSLHSLVIMVCEWVRQPPSNIIAFRRI